MHVYECIVYEYHLFSLNMIKLFSKGRIRWADRNRLVRYAVLVLTLIIKPRNALPVQNILLVSPSL